MNFRVFYRFLRNNEGKLPAAAGKKKARTDARAFSLCITVAPMVYSSSAVEGCLPSPYHMFVTVTGISLSLVVNIIEVKPLRVMSVEKPGKVMT